MIYSDLKFNASSEEAENMFYQNTRFVLSPHFVRLATKLKPCVWIEIRAVLFIVVLIIRSF